MKELSVLMVLYDNRITYFDWFSRETADRNRKNSKFQLQRTAVIEYLTSHVSGKNADFALFKTSTLFLDKVIL